MNNPLSFSYSFDASSSGTPFGIFGNSNNNPQINSITTVQNPLLVSNPLLSSGDFWTNNSQQNTPTSSIPFFNVPFGNTPATQVVEEEPQPPKNPPKQSKSILAGYTGLNEEEEKALERVNALSFANDEIEKQSEERQSEEGVQEEEEEYNSEEDGHIEPTLQNVIATVNLRCKLDLPKIQKKARNAEYNPKRFSALIMRIREPHTTALIFSSGKLVITGAKGEEEARLAAKKFARIIQKLGFPARFTDFKIQNIVASCDVGFKIALEKLANSEHSTFTSYEPEVFSGLVYKMVQPTKITILIFVSGKIVITGGKSKKGVQQACRDICAVLKSFKKE